MCAYIIMKPGSSRTLLALLLLFGLHAWTTRGFSIPQTHAFEATLMISGDDLLFPIANGRSLFEISSDADYQFVKRQVATFPNGSALYHTTTTIWRRQLQLCPGPVMVCVAPSSYYYGLPHPSALKCISSGVPIAPHGFKQYEMVVMNHFITKYNYEQLEGSGATTVIIPLLGNATFTTPRGAMLVQKFEVIAYPGHAFDLCNFTHDGEAGSLKHGYVSLGGYKRYTLDFLWTYSQPVTIAVNISCLVWYSYTPESMPNTSPRMLHYKSEVKQKLMISLVADPAITFPHLPHDQLVVPAGSSVASVVVTVHSLYKPIDLSVEGKGGRVSVKLISLTATYVTYSVSWEKPTRGRYRVVARNAKGESKTRNITVTVATAPQVLVDPVMVRAGEGDSVSFMCMVVGSSPVTINWTRDHLSVGLIQSTVPIQPQYLAKHQSGLEIVLSAVQMSDSGAYVCTASNTAGLAYEVVHLLVYHQGSHQIDTQYAGSNPGIADTHIEAAFISAAYLHHTTNQNLRLIAGTSLVVGVTLLPTISLALLKLCGRGLGWVRTRGRGGQSPDLSDTSSSESSEGGDMGQYNTED